VGAGGGGSSTFLSVQRHDQRPPFEPVQQPRDGSDLSSEAEDHRLRHLVPAYAGAAAKARTSHTDHHGTNKVSLLGRSSAPHLTGKQAILVGLSLVGFFVSFVLCQVLISSVPDPSNDDYSDYSDSDDDEVAENKLERPINNKDHRRCPMCWCCCNSVAIRFFAGTTVLTLVGGCVLWRLGILQPILSQVVMYAYITFIVSAFVSLMISQVWQLIRRLVAYIIREFRKLKAVFRIFGKKSKYSSKQQHDVMDDGPLNTMYRPVGRGRRPMMKRPKDPACARPECAVM